MDLAIDVKGFIQNVLQIPESDLPKKLVLVGWSLGCLVTMQLAAQWPELFRRMIFLSSGPITGVPVMEDDDYVTRCTSKLEVASTKRVSALNKLVSD
jgi:pimeloyl-ACP methyl ester carboxylesterase